MTDIEKMLQQSLNKTYKYGIRIIEITGYEINQERGRVMIHTNEKQNAFDRPLDEVRGLFKELIPVASLAVKNNGGGISEALTNTAMTMGAQLRDVLMDNIEKVKESKEYIPQAQAINNNVNSLINLTKMQLDYLKTAHKYKENE